MLIGVDGNEANVKNRVGSGVFAFELFKQFAKVKNHNFVIYLKDKPLADLPRETANFKYKIFGPKKLWTQFALPIRLTLGSKPHILDAYKSSTSYLPVIAQSKSVSFIADFY